MALKSANEDDLEGAPVSAFFPDFQPSSQVRAVLGATRGLDNEDLEEVTLYAQFRKARQ